MTEAMPFLQKAILLSYAPRPLAGGFFIGAALTAPEELVPVGWDRYVSKAGSIAL